MGDLLTVEEAATLARCQPRVIRQAIKLGELEALFSSRWLLDASVVEGWLRERARRRVDRPAPKRRARRARKRDERAGSVVRLSEMRGERS